MEKMIRAFRKMIQEKAEFKAYRKLIESLDNDYQFVLKEIEKYMFNLMTDESMMTVLMDTAESFAIAAADGCSVLSITGDDVGMFCENIIKKSNAKTWTDKCREKLNENIHKKFGNRDRERPCAFPGTIDIRL
jgi:DNA-binding ferritin-like protein (Dps family)